MTNLNGSGIYQILNSVNGKSYIGQARNLEGRKKEHFNDLRKGKHDSPHLQNAFNKYGEGTFEFVVLDHAEDVDTLDFWEQVYFNLFHPEYNTNLLAGRPPDQTGRHHSKKIRAQISESVKKSWTLERRQQQSKALMGHRRLVGEKVRRKIGETRRGKTWEEIYGPECAAEMRRE